MAKPYKAWQGNITFGMITVPVGIYKSTRDAGVKFKSASRAGSKVKIERKDTQGNPIGKDDIVKVAAAKDGTPVVLLVDEIEAIKPEKTHAMDIVDFVDLDDIDDAFYGEMFYVSPYKTNVKAYRLLLEAMKSSNKAAVARLVQRSKEITVVFYPKGDFFVGRQMYYVEEMVDPAEIPEMQLLHNVEPLSEDELRMADYIVSERSVEWLPNKYHDRFQEKLEELIEEKKGRKVTWANNGLGDNVLPLFG